MRAITLILLTMVAASSAAAATLYKWVDDQGRTHYSDRPHQGAEVIDLQPAQSYSAPPSSRSTTRPEINSSSGDDAPAAVSYQVRLTSPEQDQVLWNIGGTLNASIEISPGLQTGHRIVVSMNGQAVESWPPTASSAQIPDVFRGTHTLAASVVDTTGKVLASATSVTFHVKQTSVLHRRPD